ncbi:MAG: PDDEXK nuclease domain-containing protein [Candidatus Delongbacteria bacterium]|jgi:predicted nuclease of restriction endonuclease-like (RecB) superfamily|nr:PDDEXK nuclease domain-containing protein [Candidatus Delongbacteria bacterium]
MNLKKLINTLEEVNSSLRNEAIKAVNIYLTLRNWYFGYYIYEFEQNGSDRAEYGKHVLSVISKNMKLSNISNCDERELRRYRQFYTTYPKLGTIANSTATIRGMASPEFKNIVKSPATIRGTASPELMSEHEHLKSLFTRLSYSHLSEIMRIEDKLKRYFYEIECLNCMWSVSELKRQVGSMLFERTGLSSDKTKLLKKTKSKNKELQWSDTIKDPYIFEFAGFKNKDVFTEKTLEQALVDHLQNFILELGNGFCFEARQKRITIDSEHYFIDLVFYNRILHCNVLIELKTSKFHHTHASQLNMYVEYYKKYEMRKGDNPPVGILLCTDKDSEHVEFATAGMDKKLFVSTYMVSLPDIEDLKEFMRKEMIMKEADVTSRKRIEGK